MLLRLFIVSLIVTASGCVSNLFSETVKLVNGKAIVGDLIKVAAETVSVESKGEEVVIRKDRIQSIVFQEYVEDVNKEEAVSPDALTPKEMHKTKRYAIGFEVAQDADQKLDPFGLSIYIQHIWDSGVGFQANLGVYGADVDSYHTLGHVNYTIPVILHYHFFRDSVIRPFAGIGVSRSQYTSEKWWGMSDWARKEKKGYSPLADIGFAFGGDSPLQVVVNMKYFVSLYTSKANMLTAGVGVSINW